MFTTEVPHSMHAFMKQDLLWGVARFVVTSVNIHERTLRIVARCEPDHAVMIEGLPRYPVARFRKNCHAQGRRAVCSRWRTYVGRNAAEHLLPDFRVPDLLQAVTDRALVGFL